MENEEKELVDFVVTARKYKTTLTKNFLERKKWERPNPGVVKSVLPGQVLSINVAIGDKVNKGDLLLIHEAMKMRNRILSPITGTVKEIAVKTGERVTKYQEMITIEE